VEAGGGSKTTLLGVLIRGLSIKLRVSTALFIDRMGLDGGKRSRVCRGPLVELSNG
jgi:hypothetical protein